GIKTEQFQHKRLKNEYFILTVTNKTKGENFMKKLVIIFVFINLLFSGIILGNDLKTGLTASDLHCEYKVTPVTDVKNPRLSWILNSDERGQCQTAYQKSFQLIWVVTGVQMFGCRLTI
ncbi:MAG: glycoside hydrolase family 78 protein, partial [Candidatus Doudnabacteria bacterium]